MDKLTYEISTMLRQRLVARRIIPIETSFTKYTPYFGEPVYNGVCNTSVEDVNGEPINTYWKDVAPLQRADHARLVDEYVAMEDTMLLVGARNYDGMMNLADNTYPKDICCDAVFHDDTHGRSLPNSAYIHWSNAIPIEHVLIVPHLGAHGAFSVKFNCDFNIIEISDNTYRIWFSVNPIKVRIPNMIYTTRIPNINVQCQHIL